MLRRLYDRVLALSANPRAPAWLAAISFAESSFFPIPPDALLIPMILARPDRAFRLALVCTAASVAGGVLGYVVGVVPAADPGELPEEPVGEHPHPLIANLQDLVPG